MKTVMRTRNDFANLLNELGFTGEAAFIGVAAAYFEAYFLERWTGKASWIDPYKILNTPGFSGHGEDTDYGQEERYRMVLLKAQNFGPRCKVIRATSEEAAPMFADGSLDMVYVDADHSVEGITSDTALWWPKLKRGGLFTGHDYVPDGLHNGQLYGVKGFIGSFAEKIGVAVNVTHEKDWPSYYFAKP